MVWSLNHRESFKVILVLLSVRYNNPNFYANLLIFRSITNNLKDSPFWVYLSSDGIFPTSHLLKIVSQRAVLLLLPLRLGIDAVNPIYGQFIRGALRSSCSLGIVGGLPEKSLYFVGYQDWDLFFLDPHILKPFDQSAFSDPDKLIKDYHTARVRSIPIEEIDPSMLFGFICCSAEEVVQLRDHLIKLNRHANILSIKND